MFGNIRRMFARHESSGNRVWTGGRRRHSGRFRCVAFGGRRFLLLSISAGAGHLDDLAVAR